MRRGKTKGEKSVAEAVQEAVLKCGTETRPKGTLRRSLDVYTNVGIKSQTYSGVTSGLWRGSKKKRCEKGTGNTGMISIHRQ